MAIHESGLDTLLSNFLGGALSNQPLPVILFLLGVAGIMLTGFLSNTAASAVLIPIVTSLSAISGKTIEDLNLETLYQRLENGGVSEIIIATSATIDGQTTAHFLAENLKKFPLKITRLAHGIPIGSELDYLDEGTIAIAFKTRSEL